MSSEDGVNEFYAREQEELGELSDEVCGDTAVTGRSPIIHPSATTCCIPIEPASVKMSTETAEQPECIRKWAKEFEERVRLMDSDEQAKVNAMEEQGLQDLHTWATQYRDALSRAVKNSRQHDKELRAEQDAVATASVSLSNADASQPALWDRVCHLCNFVTPNPEEAGSVGQTNTSAGLSAKQSTVTTSVKDMNRMRVVLLQLKQNPPLVRRMG